LVDRTLHGSPAEEAGIRPGDVIAGIEGRSVGSVQDLLEAVANAGPQARILLDVWRGSELVRTRTTTSERPLVAND
jgi:S1-C subfamily serine protease